MIGSAVESSAPFENIRKYKSCANPNDSHHNIGYIRSLDTTTGHVALVAYITSDNKNAVSVNINNDKYGFNWFPDRLEKKL